MMGYPLGGTPSMQSEATREELFFQRKRSNLVKFQVEL